MAPPSSLEIDENAITPLMPGDAASASLEPALNPAPEQAAITPAEGPPASLSLSPRKGAGDAQPTSLQDAPADQLLVAAWQQIGGTTLVDQVKTVLAAFGVLSVVVFAWRMISRSDEPGEAE
jgi:hypothetical protein